MELGEGDFDGNFDKIQHLFCSHFGQKIRNLEHIKYPKFRTIIRKFRTV